MKYRDSVRDLCFIVDRELRVLLNIKQLTCKCYCKRRDFRNFSRPLSSNAPANIFDVFLTSRLSHCSSILPGFPMALLHVSTECFCVNRTKMNEHELPICTHTRTQTRIQG